MTHLASPVRCYHLRVAPFRLLAATNNAHKIAEFRRLLSAAPVDLVTPAELGLAVDVEEDGTTYAENALLKARAFAAASGLPALADDSGIEVDALQGGPGLYSARYGGPGLDDEGRTNLLLEALRDTPDGQRGCRYVAVLAIAWPGGDAETFEGTCDGTVARAVTGANGFGYDPVFEVPGKGRTMAELSAGEKDAISHRGLAMQAVVRRLQALAAPEARA